MTSRTRKGQRGVALLLVIWTFAVLTVLAAEFARAMRDEAMATRNYKEETLGHYACIAGINEVLLALLTQRKNQDDPELAGVAEEGFDEEMAFDPIALLSTGGGEWVKARYNGIPYEVRVFDERGRFGLNHVSEEVLIEVMGNLGLDDDVAATISDSILDWRDEDEEHRLKGAEDDYYDSLPRPYQAKDGPFDSVQELLLVRGVSQEIFYGDEEFPGLGDLFTVFNRSSCINPRSMSKGVIQALSGFDSEEADRILKIRNRSARVGPVQSEVGDVVQQSAACEAGGKDPVDITIEARVIGPDGAVHSHIGSVLKLEQSGASLRLYRWYDYVFDSEPKRRRDDAEQAERG